MTEPLSERALQRLLAMAAEGDGESAPAPAPWLMASTTLM